MPSRVHSAFLSGLSGVTVIVEVDSMKGLPSFEVVGMTDVAIQEAKKRVKSALKNSDLPFPKEKIVVNLAPAHRAKRGTQFDVPIALGLLIEKGCLSAENLNGVWCLGELGLGGELRGCHGVLPLVQYAKEQGATHVLVPTDNAEEAALVEGITCLAASTIREALGVLVHRTPHVTSVPSETNVRASFPFEMIQGNTLGKQAMVYAAAGGHNVFLMGPPGTGKTLLAQGLASVMPSLSFEEAVEVSRIYSVADQLPPGKALITTRPFRQVHHTISAQGLIGGGARPVPGEISLAHKGVLFLDEVGEFPKKTLELLRQPMEAGEIQISRSRETVLFPAQFQVVAASNPCPCGFWGDELRVCTCPSYKRKRYQEVFSGPFMDRFDLFVSVHHHKKYSTDSKKMNIDLEHIRQNQYDRQGKINAHLSVEEIQNKNFIHSTLRKEAEQFSQKFLLSLRGHHRVLRLARTIADVHCSPKIEKEHVLEACGFRKKINSTPLKVSSG